MSIQFIKFRKLNELPETPDNTTVYFIGNKVYLGNNIVGEVAYTPVFDSANSNLVLSIVKDTTTEELTFTANLNLRSTDNLLKVDGTNWYVSQSAIQTLIDAHANLKNNPHKVTKAQIDLGNVDNTSDLSKPISTATQTALNNKANVSDLNTHTEDKSNPHNVTVSQIGAEPAIGPKGTAFNKDFGTTAETVAKGNHTHSYASITGKPTTFTPSSHTHPISEITDLQSTLDGKASSTHTHLISEINNLQSSLDSKSNSSHNHDATYSKLGHKHSKSDITDFPDLSVYETKSNKFSPTETDTWTDNKESTDKYPTVKAVTDELDKKIDKSSIVKSTDTWGGTNIADDKVASTASVADAIEGLVAGDMSDALASKADTSYVNAQLSTKVDKVAGKGLSTEDYTSAEKTKLAGIATGANVNVQPDWSQTVTTADDYIKNKPALHTVATSGSYNDLEDIPQAIDLTGKEDKSNKVASFIITETNDRYPSALLVKTELSKKENTSNKATTWSTTVNDTRYPSEKLVKDSLDGKVPTSRTINTKPLTSNITLSASDVNAAPAAHNHDTVYAKITHTHHWNDITDKPTKFAPTEHNHDDKYSLLGHGHSDLLKGIKIKEGTGETTLTPTNQVVTIDVTGYKNVQPDWSQTVTTADDYIKNKPTTFAPAEHNHDDRYYTKTEVDTSLSNKVDKVTGKGLSTNDFTTTLKNKLDGIATGANVNVQPNWTQTDNTKDDFIKNKPSTFTPSSHSHPWSDITGTPTTLAGYGITDSIELTTNKVSTFTNNVANDTKYPSAKLVHTELGKKENTSNKVTTWSTTVNDTRYPSEKLVKTSLDGKVPTSRTINGKALSSNISLTASNVGALPITGGTLTGTLTTRSLEPSTTNIYSLGSTSKRYTEIHTANLYAGVVIENGSALMAKYADKATTENALNSKINKSKFTLSADKKTLTIDLT